MSKISKLNKWQSLAKHTNFILLDNLHNDSANQQYIEPSSTFPKTKDGSKQSNLYPFEALFG